MIKIEPIRPPIDYLRRWHIFFCDDDAGWWRLITRKGFRHVEAAAYFADQDRWVFVLPSREHFRIEVRRPEESGPIYTAMMLRAHAILAFNGRKDRTHVPVGPSCVGMIKALTGIKSRALWPHGLYADLLRQGAEVIDVPILSARTPSGRSGSSETAGAGGGACEAGPDQGGAGAVAA